MSKATPNADYKTSGFRYAASYLFQCRDASIVDEDFSDQAAFMALVTRLQGRYQSQLGQDLFALAMTGFARSRYFVEVGAYHGVVFSNTLLLEQAFGWHGLLVEANSRNIDSLRARRAKLVQKAAWRKSGEILKFHATADSSLSNLALSSPNDAHDRSSFIEVEVETMTLNDILSAEGAPTIIDFMSIDIEGAELSALEGLDLDRWDIRTLALEHNHDHTRIAAFDSILTPKGFVRVFDAIADFDCYYVKPACLVDWRAFYRQPDPFASSA